MKIKTLEAMKQALEALEARCGTNADERKKVIPNLRAAIEEMDQAEPIAWMYEDSETYHFTNLKSYSELFKSIPLYIHPAPAPKGWQLVPVEPTDHMRTEGRETYRNDGDELNIWLTMLAAAPKPGDKND